MNSKEDMLVLPLDAGIPTLVVHLTGCDSQKLPAPHLSKPSSLAPSVDLSLEAFILPLVALSPDPLILSPFRDEKGVSDAAEERLQQGARAKLVQVESKGKSENLFLGFFQELL
ncbi:hypothetical protein MRB53_034491 [Persea americana]|uniref:Uncharacterized protein n=1 Tax=Persea americana TaxID=3435 RepID=A0ACC2K2A2_PERAE|nr:hypothetical protein MRB53_034491 [Persea americana]